MHAIARDVYMALGSDFLMEMGSVIVRTWRGRDLSSAHGAEHGRVPGQARSVATTDRSSNVGRSFSRSGCLYFAYAKCVPFPVAAARVFNRQKLSTRAKTAGVRHGALKGEPAAA